ncbi:MAG: phytanoyl-CoA dioxygenase family protein [Bryobacteraceae bacterium]
MNVPNLNRLVREPVYPMTAVLEQPEAAQFDLDAFVQEVHGRGFAVVPNLLEAEFLNRMRGELMQAIRAESELPYNNARDRAMVLLCSLYGGTFLELFENEKLLACANALLGDGSTVYAYTSSSMPPKGTNFSRRIHVDCPRVIPGYMTNLGVLMAIDDFTEENGATFFLPYSQERTDAPSESFFYRNAYRFTCKAGSAIFFNARVWHCGGDNQTDQWRHGLSINIGRPWMKQRIDIPRAMAHMDLTGVPETVLQKLGFLAQVPANYAEYYVAPEKRKFRQKYE